MTVVIEQCSLRRLPKGNEKFEAKLLSVICVNNYGYN